MEITLHVCLCGRTTVNFGVIVYESNVLPLLLRILHLLLRMRGIIEPIRIRSGDTLNLHKNTDRTVVVCSAYIPFQSSDTSCI